MSRSIVVERMQVSTVAPTGDPRFATNTTGAVVAVHRHIRSGAE
jgi:hypothetical protein